MIIGKRNFEIGKKTYIMGILNATPDSFSDGGKYENVDAAVEAAKRMIEEGADIIDVGGESTRPGFTPISDEEEIKRIVPVIEGIKKECDIPVSADTYKFEVAKKALESGADMINDIWGLKKDIRIAELVAKHDAVLCIASNGEEISEKEGEEFCEYLLQDLAESAKKAIDLGVSKDKIILDPGVGFGKVFEQNLDVLKHAEMFARAQYPVLFAISRKSVIGLSTGFAVDERDEATIATTVLAAKAGIDFVRVHNVDANAKALKMTEIILRG